MKQSHRGAESHSASQETPPPPRFMEPEGSLLRPQEPTTVLYPEADESSPYLPNPTP
jgi:hypothetical protein